MLLNVEDHRRRARRVLPRFVFDYIDAGADDGACMTRNRARLDACVLTPRVLRDTTRITSNVTLFGQSWRHPVGIGPTGLNGLLRPGADAALARAAADAGLPFILSTASNQRLESVCDAARETSCDANVWLQLYVMQDRSIAEQLVHRARSADVKALVLTVDVAVSGNRERDRRNGFVLPLRPSLRLALDLLRHPVWSLRMARSGTPRFANLVADPQARLSAQAQAALLSRAMDRSLDWDALRWLRSLWSGPLLVKGLLHPDDARLALQHGIDGIIVSNHGGRQLDSAPATIDALPAIADALQGRIPLLMDSGIRRGADVLRALSLGADAVLIGRPVLYGLAHGGMAGAQAVLRLLLQEMELAQTLLGVAHAGSWKPGVADRR